MKRDLNAELEAEIYISPHRALELSGGARLASSRVPGPVEVTPEGVTVGGRPLLLRPALRCPARVGGLYLCGGPPERPRYLQGEAHAPGLDVQLRLAELYSTDRLNRGDCLAELLHALARGRGPLWRLYRRAEPGPVGGPCGWALRHLLARGLREGRPYAPPQLDRWTAALLGLLRFGEALEMVERSWRGLAVALRYGVYGALGWRLEPGPDMWLLLFGLYAALDPLPVPGGVALDAGILRALPYLVVRVMGRWAVLFSSAGRRFTAANFNPMVDGGRLRAFEAHCAGHACVVGDLRFNICGEAECAVVRTWDFEVRGPLRCFDHGPFLAWRPCV